MKRTVLFAALAASVFAQPPAFDAASVRIHTADNAEGSTNGPWIQTSPVSVAIRNARLLWCLGWAYNEKDWLISGPDWITSERYDIIAKTPSPVPTTQLKLMLQTLLADRFKLALHHETKELPVAVLVLAKNGPKNLRTAAASGPPEGPRPLGGKQFHALVYQSVSMADFAERLGGPLPFGVGESLVDETGIKGAFDITLNLDTEHFTGGRDEFPGFLKAALEQQFGLKIGRRKVLLDTLVIDRGNKTPTEN